MKVSGLFLIQLLLILPGFSQSISPKKAYVNHTEVGLLLGRVSYDGNYGWGGGNPNQIVKNRTNLSMQMFNGLQYNHRLAVGLTTGLDWYTAALINPLAAGARYDLTGKKNVRLFATADAGYGFAWFHKNSEGYHLTGGTMLNPGLGLRFGKPDGTAFTLSLSYKYQQARLEIPTANDIESRVENREYNRLALRMGLLF
ncbi:hypothetical protein [Arundinibacter roseus]|uniref:Outer membrane protein beta-barrel domain-containing protein n=1 Tax=Arundinibacter roseus TaxID=2070510 RepID=A0A4R4KLM4_9BACT|nr:hypothetical protein [Arundinibacter roseus]TDB69178.1 hypothetical protein EZE20_02240 [Arundinibacter roseus]